MAKTTPSDRVRLFVALDPPPDARRELAEWRDSLLGGRDELRLVAEDALHVTLAFLGWRPAGEADAIAACLEATSPAPLLTPAGLAAVPPRRPRLVALDLDDDGGRATALQARLSGVLSAGGFFEPETRPFWPHITLARVRKGARMQAQAEHEPPPAAFTATALTLYRSTLHPSGARYEPLARLTLGA